MREHGLNNKDFILDEIESIELMGDQETIDITVEDTHMFFANDIYTHNSGSEQDIVQAGSIADSYRKIMTADFVLSLSRKINDKENSTARFHVIKNRFGSDGMTFPAIMNTSNGDIRLFKSDSEEGMNIQSKMNDVENSVKKMLKDKWNSREE